MADGHRVAMGHLPAHEHRPYKHGHISADIGVLGVKSAVVAHTGLTMGGAKLSDRKVLLSVGRAKTIQQLITHSVQSVSNLTIAKAIRKGSAYKGLP